jgi:hypothetical protein
MLSFLLILAYYDRPRIVRNALNSIAHLQSENWELVVIDDGSPRPIKPIATRILKRFKKRSSFSTHIKPASKRIFKEAASSGSTLIKPWMNQMLIWSC